MKTIKLSTDNVNTLLNSYTIGDSKISAKYKLPKGKAKLAMFITEINSNWTEQQIDEYLSQFELTIKE